jgi:hypothetical protein
MRWDAGWCWFSLLFTEPITSGAPQGKLPIFISRQKAAGKYKKQRGGRPATLSSLYHIFREANYKTWLYHCITGYALSRVIYRIQSEICIVWKP